MDAGHDYLVGRFSDVTSVTWNERILTSKEVNKSRRYLVNLSISTCYSLLSLKDVLPFMFLTYWGHEPRITT